MPRQEYAHRQFLIYLPSEEELESWRVSAKEYGISLSKYIYEIVELGRHAEEAQPKEDIVKEHSQLREENQNLRVELKTKSMLLERLESEIYKARYADFAEFEIHGSRQIDEQIVKILKKGKTIDGYAILKELCIDPHDSEVAKLVGNQLDAIRRYGLVEETPRGWRWIA
jgi:hypothetical protein